MLLTSFLDRQLVHQQPRAPVLSSNFGALFKAPIPEIIGRTVLLALLVTLTDAVLAFPFAYFMAGLPLPACATLYSWPCCYLCGRAAWLVSTPGSSS